MQNEMVTILILNEDSHAPYIVHTIHSTSGQAITGEKNWVQWEKCAI